MRGLVQEVRHAVRSMLKRPAFTATASGILALGLGLTSYMFGAINAYVLRPLPFPEPQRLVQLESGPATGRGESLPMPDFLDWREAQQTLAGIAGFYTGTVNLSDNERPERYSGAFVTANTFALAGIAPLLGRAFADGDDAPGAPAVVILGHELWQHRYAADASILGREVRVNGRPATVVGVMPPGFRFPEDEEVWVPATLDRSSRRGHSPTLQAFGRLRPGVSLEQARGDLKAIADRLAREHPDTNADTTAFVRPLTEEYVGPETRQAIYTMFAAVCLVLLIACANVANLMLARAAGRRRELAIRSALGAHRARLIAHVLAECLVISLIGGGLGYFAATWAGEVTMAALRASETMRPPYFVQFTSDWRTAGFGLGSAFAAALLAGLLPALRATRLDVQGALRQGGHAVAASPLGRLSSGFLTAQVAFSCVVLVCAGLMARSVVAVQRVEVGADTDGVLSGRVGLFESAYPSAAERVLFFERLAERAAALPGVTAVTVSTSLPATFTGGAQLTIDGKETPANAPRPFAQQVAALPNYFATFRIPVLQGRGFLAADKADGQPVAVVNRLLAESHWPGRSAIGRRIQLGGDDSRWRTIVGVVPNVVQGPIDNPVRPTVYLPLAQTAPRFASIALRTAGPPMRLAEALRKALLELDKDVPVYWLRPLSAWIERGRFESRFMATLFGSFAVVGLLLGAAGQYAVLAYAVGQRTREIGVRRALGARDGEILRATLREGLRHLALALPLGVLISFAFARLLESELFGVSSSDPVTLAGVPLSLAAAVVVASLLPARRALAVDPAAALRCE